MRSTKRAQGIRTAAGASVLDGRDSTMTGTYWFDLRARTPVGARMKRVVDVTVATALLVLLAPLLLFLYFFSGVVVERRVGFRGNELRAYRFGGRFLRRLPELVNVLEGSMSLVGPRAPLRDEVQHFNARRFSMVPGMTGLWRVRGGSEADADRAYVNEWSFGLDLRILVLTVLRW